MCVCVCVSDVQLCVCECVSDVQLCVCVGLRSWPQSWFQRLQRSTICANTPDSKWIPPRVCVCVCVCMSTYALYRIAGNFDGLLLPKYLAVLNLAMAS